MLVELVFLLRWRLYQVFQFITMETDFLFFSVMLMFNWYLVNYKFRFTNILEIDFRNQSGNSYKMAGVILQSSSFLKQVGNFYVTAWSETSITLFWRRSISYRNQSIDLLCNSMDWFLYDRDLRQKRVKTLSRI